MLTKKLFDGIIQDVTALGAAPFFGFLILLSFIQNLIGLSVELLLGFILSYAAAIIIRLFHFKERPKKESHRNMIEKLAASSFPSLHSMRVTIYCLLFASTFPNPLTWVAFTALALSVYYSRYYLQKHFITDIVWGAIIGALIAAFLIIY